MRLRAADNLDDSGRGRVEIDGRSYDLSGVLPGELVDVVIAAEGRAEVGQIIKPSPDRVPPRCPRFGRCGGCDLRHLAYVAETAFKQALAGRLLGPDRSSGPIVTSPLDDGYRYRVRFHVQRRGRALGPGFFEPRSRRFVPLDDCPVLASDLRPVLPALWEALAGAFFLRHGRHFDQVELAAGLERGGPILVLWRLKPGAPKSLIKTLTALSLPGTVTEITINGEVRGQRPGANSVLVLDHRGLQLRAGPGVFFQANLALNPRLVDLVLSTVRGDGPVLDLFCGLGNFTLPLAVTGRPVTGVENNPAAVADARRGAQAAGLTAVDLMEADVMEAFNYLEPGRFETVVLDPPRRGAPRVADQVARLGPARIVYVSCNPRFLARDLQILEQSGYELQSLTPLDMFPRTVHLEVVAVLDRHGVV